MSKAVRFLCVGIGLASVAGGCTKNSNSSPSSPTCSFSVTQPATTSFGADGGSGTVSVTAASGCAWTAVSNASFITVTQGSSGSGNGSVQFSVAANTGADRSGSLTVAGSSVGITQRAAAPTVALSAPVARSPIGGAEINVARPALVVDNAVATGAVGSVTYRFELSDQNSFPPDRTSSVDGIAQGSGSTSWTPERDLPGNSTFYWRARATDGTTTSPFSNIESFKTGTLCTFVVSPNAVTVSPAGGTASVNVTASSSCGWTATSNAAFVTIASGGSGTGNGTVTLTVAQNGGSARTGSVTIAGQTVTVSQGANGVVASFRLLDPATTGGPTTECRFKSLTGAPTTCTLESTSFAVGTSTILSYTWVVRYTYLTVRELTQSGIDPRFSFTDTCGKVTSTDDGVAQPLEVTLTVVDSLGNTATARAGSGSQPALTVRLFSCGI